MKLLFQILLILASLAIFISGAYYFTLWKVHDYSKDFLEADSCLGSGGIYVYEEQICYMPGQCEDLGGKWNSANKKCDK